MKRALLVAAVAACGGPTATVVTVEVRPEVESLDQLIVHLAMDGATFDQTFDVDGVAPPYQFAVETPDRAGELSIDIEGLAPNNVVVGVGGATTLVTAGDLGDTTVLLSPADFVVNASFAGGQNVAPGSMPGNQIDADSGGTSTIVFSDCPSTGSCEVRARRISAAGVPGASQLTVSRLTMATPPTPAVAVNDNGAAVVVWATADDVRCAGVDLGGNLLGSADRVLAASEAPDSAVITSFGPDRYVVAWIEGPSNARDVFAQIVDGTCTPQLFDGSSAPFQVNLLALGPATLAVESTLTTVCFAYRNRESARESIRGRCIEDTFMLGLEFTIVADNAQGSEPLLLGGPTLVGHDGGFVMAYTARHTTAFPNGAVLLRTLDPTGNSVAAETTLASAVQPSIAPAIGRRNDGRLLAVWYDCAGSNGCDILGRYADSNGQPLADLFTVNNTDGEEQTHPSVVGLDTRFATTWTDSSMTPPDDLDTAVRARVLFPN